MASTQVREMTLDGAPAMSVNVLSLILDSFRSFSVPCRVLEWGSGNSTLAIVRNGLEGKKAFVLVSIEHDEAWHERVVEAVASVLAGCRPVRRETKALTDEVRLPPPRQLARKLYMLENAANVLYAATDEWNIKRSRGYVSGGSRGVWRVAAMFGEAFLQWKAAQVGLMLRSALEALGRRPARGARVTALTGSSFGIFLLFVPSEGSLLGSTCTYDGLAGEFYRYVTVGLPHAQYELILVDGRARASCLKRIFLENLVGPEGIVYCHDAYRQAYWGAFELFRDFSLVAGNGVRIDGRPVTRRVGYPTVKQGREPTSAVPVIANELFVYAPAGGARRGHAYAPACEAEQ